MHMHQIAFLYRLYGSMAHPFYGSAMADRSLNRFADRPDNNFAFL